MSSCGGDSIPPSFLSEHSRRQYPLLIVQQLQQAGQIRRSTETRTLRCSPGGFKKRFNCAPAPRRTLASQKLPRPEPRQLTMSAIEGVQVRPSRTYIAPVRRLIDIIESARAHNSRPKIRGLPGGVEISEKWRRLRCEGAVSARPGVSYVMGRLYVTRVC